MAPVPERRERRGGADRSLHVCFLTSSAPLGPGDAYSPFILSLAESLTSRGHRITILTPHVAGAATRETLGGVEVRRYRYLPRASAETLGLGGGMLPGLRRRRLDILKVPFLLAGQYRALSALHARDPLDLLHSHWMIPQGVIGGFFAKRRAIPHVSTAHGSDLLDLRFPGAGRALHLATRWSRATTVNSSAMEERLRDRAGPCDVRVIAIGARVPDPGAVTGNLDLRDSLSGGRGIVGFVGRVVEKKGILEFVRLIGALRSQGHDVVGLVVGSGAAERRARDLAEELGVREALRFAGSVEPERVSAYLSAVDVLAVPSHHEGQGLAAVEAMLLGVPVVAFRTGGLRKLVVDEVTGLAVERGDLDALTAAVRRLLTEPGLGERLGRRAHEGVVGRFTLDIAAERFDALYQEVSAAQ